MITIGVDFHPEFQQIAWVDTETGELQERRLQHREEAESFYRELAARAVQVRVGVEASGHELWIGDAAEWKSPVGTKLSKSTADSVLPKSWN